MEGRSGNFRVTLTRKPRYIIEDQCTGCGTCVEYCPVKIPDPFNQEISRNKAVHIYFAQAIPLIAYIDESCLYLKEKKCRICETACQNGAINLNQRESQAMLEVGSILLAPGYEPFDPRINDEFGYGRYPNVVTSLDFERLLCATGPHEGEILRASDLKHPHKIAWIQCVGSRRVSQGNHGYCSAVCCTYTQKQVILTKDHDESAQCAIFHNDIRSYGKDFELYQQRTAALEGTRFIRSYATVAGEAPGSQNPIVRYSTPEEGVKEEEFDMVVLSVGLSPPKDHERLAELFGIELNQHGFVRKGPANAMQTSRPGVYVSGAFQGPMDIPESVFTASGAGSLCGEQLDYRRGKLARARVYPEERDLSQDQPRIGVFVCHCGANIGRIVKVPSAVAYALTLPNVVYAQEQLFSCATNSAQQITDKVREQNLNRVVIAACSPRTLEPLFKDTLREAGINPYYCEMANIREHCSWVHAKEPERATQKAKDIIRLAVARAGCLRPLQDIQLPVNKNALVVGGGLAGMTCALSIAKQGHEVYLLEKEAELGGLANRIHSTLEGLDVPAYLDDLRRAVFRNPAIHVLTQAEIIENSGYIGNFMTTVQSERGLSHISHGATVVATGAGVYEPSEYLHGQDQRVLTHLELEARMARRDEDLLSAQCVVMIQCVGCRNQDRNYCSRVCCGESVKNAIGLKELNPEMEVFILYRDMRTYGFLEDHYRRASEMGVKFIRYEPERPPSLREDQEEGRPVLRVGAMDYILGAELGMAADLVVLAAAVVPQKGNQELAQRLKISLGPDGFFKEAHVKLRPVEFATDGVYLCGMAHYPKYIPETISQAQGAAGRALTLLSHDTVTVSGSVCEVNEKRCMGCGACVAACTYGAIELRKSKGGAKASVNPVICKGDGLCNAKCPTGAIFLKHFTDQALLSQIDAIRQEEQDPPLTQAAREAS